MYTMSTYHGPANVRRLGDTGSKVQCNVLARALWRTRIGSVRKKRLALPGKLHKLLFEAVMKRVMYPLTSFTSREAAIVTPRVSPSELSPTPSPPVIVEETRIAPFRTLP